MRQLRGTSLIGAVLMVVASSAPALAAATSPEPRRPERRLQPVQPKPPRTVALRALSGCAETSSYIVEVAVETVLSARYSRWRILPWAGGAEGDGGGRPTDFSSTNNQEPGVDELDIVKTDGTHLYAVEGAELHAIESWPAEATRELATVATPDFAHGLFLRSDRVLVASQIWSGEAELLRADGLTRFELLDVRDASAPRSLRTIDIQGWLVDARLIGSHLYAVVRSQVVLPDEIWELAWRDDLGLPELAWDADEDELQRVLALARSILSPLVAEIVNRTDMAELLPRMRDRAAGEPEGPVTALLDCEELYRPVTAASLALLSVIHFDLESEGPVSAVGLLADGWTVYSSADALYAAQSGGWWWWGWAPPAMATTVHKFELEPEGAKPVRYAASGQVEGWILDQFAMSEHEGHLRVATTEFDWWWGTTEGEDPASSVTVLADDGRGSLEQVGRVDGLGPGERIFAVRFLGDTGYVVTFRQVDPLYTLDLADPANPAVVGELEVTGFSSYLHPIGDDWLLAVGMEADDEGRVLGLAVSLFDVSDLARPRLAHRHLIEGDEGTWSWSEALADHHAFTFHRGVLSIPAYLSGPDGTFSGLIVLEVDTVDGIRELGRIDHRDLAGANPEPWMRRSVVIEDRLYSLSSAGVKVNDLQRPEIEYARVPFGE
jgi:uncharacterized secreted protein with C-terminal beta-propeller domain